jgi:hypothetical protein
MLPIPEDMLKEINAALEQKAILRSRCGTVRVKRFVCKWSTPSRGFEATREGLQFRWGGC